MRRGGFDLRARLEVDAGSVTAVLGPNGAGKTTLLRALAGLEPLDSGRVDLDGDCLEDVSRQVRVAPERRSVGMVPQDLLLFPHLTVLDNVAFGPRARGMSRVAARHRAAEWLERLLAEDLAPRRPAALSGGQRQRVALARALATEPRLVLLDEPLSALDNAARAEMRQTLRRAVAGHGGVWLLVTHDPIDAEALAGQVVVIEAGLVVQEGTFAEVAAQPRTPWVARMMERDAS